MKKIVIKVKADVLKRNKMHFEIQKKTRMQVFSDKTKYSRKNNKRLIRKEMEGAY